MKGAAPQERIRHPGVLVGRTVIFEILRRRDLYVLLILALLFTAGIIVMNIVGIENAATATFLLNLGMTLASAFAHILVILASTRQIPDDVENRTIYPILAKPIRRVEYLAGKWAALWLCGVMAYAVLFLLGWAPVPRMESFSGTLLIQVIGLQILSLGLAVALGLFFSLILPRGSAALALAILVFGGGKIVAFLRMKSTGSFEAPVRWLTAYIPDFGMMNLATRYTDGLGPVTAPEFTFVLLAGVLFTVLIFAVTHILFDRRPL